MKSTQDDVIAKRRAMARAKAGREIARTASELRGRSDYRPEFEYFIERLGETAGETAERLGRPLVGMLCVQAPFELFHALGLQPYRLFSGSQAYGQSVAAFLPALACPLLRSTLGALAQVDSAGMPWVVPMTCDWIVKFPEMAELAGLSVPERMCWLELPHLKEQPEGRKRWLEEIGRLIGFLEGVAGRRLVADTLRDSMEQYQAAWRVFGSLVEKRRRGMVPAVWFTVIANAFLRDAPEAWSAALEKALPCFGDGRAEGKRVFLAGSPLFYPNLKLPVVLEEAGLIVTADDLCSSERILPGAAFYRDPMLPGLLVALAERYHQGCLCPTFADNQRRPAGILNQLEHFDGVVHQVLKGCHPYDLESFGLEKLLKGRGIRFLRVETDYADEDRQNLLTRLEAFRASL